MQRITILQPVRSTAPNAAYPDGSAQNETVAGANDGTPFELARSNDIFGLQQAMLHQLGIVPSGLAETAIVSQFLEGVSRLASVTPLYVDSGAADAYVLARIGAGVVQAPSAYFDGMEIVFKASNANTGASNVNVAGLGSKSLTLQDGTALTAGLIPQDRFVAFRYNLASDRFELLGQAFATKTQQEAEVATDVAVSPAVQQDHPSAAKAWVHFDGTGVVTIRESSNVSSVTDNGVGDYTVNVATLLNSTTYPVIVSTVTGLAFPHRVSPVSTVYSAPTTGTFKIVNTNTLVVALDSDSIQAAAFAG